MSARSIHVCHLLPLALAVRAVSVPTTIWTHEQAVCRTRGWIENAVIRLGLCPFASKPFYEKTIR
eukprot:scaffold19989_cov112-Isochrysis_galbana.AAC.2